MVEDIIIQLKVLREYYDSNIKDEILVLWAKDLLEDYSLEDIKTSIKSYRKNEVYSPTLAGIIKYIPKTKIDYGEVILNLVRQYGEDYERAKTNCDSFTYDLFRQYAHQVGMSEPNSTNQKFLLKDINDEAEASLKFNTTTQKIYIENKELNLIE